MGLRLAVKDIRVIDKLFYWFGRVQLIRKEIPMYTLHYHRNVQ
jgi:hypothetical protein